MKTGRRERGKPRGIRRKMKKRRRKMLLPVVAA
jgi:hypothetical protein